MILQLYFNRKWYQKGNKIGAFPEMVEDAEYSISSQR